MLDNIIKRILKNTGILFSGNVITGAIGVISLSITARVLGVEQLGMLALIQAYVMTIDKLFNFQSWQALIKYGSDALTEKKPLGFKSLIKFGFSIDVGSAVVGTIIALISARWIGQLFNWDVQMTQLCAIYSFTILFHINGTPTAILRVFNKFNIITIHNVIASVLILLGTIVALLQNQALEFFVYMLTTANIIGHIVLILFALLELKRRKYIRFINSSLKGIFKRHPKLWAFVWTTNINSSIKMSIKELDTIIVGYVLGASATGLYKVAKQATAAMSKLSNPFYQVIYPEFTRLWSNSKKDDFQKLLIKTSLIIGTLGSFIWLFFALLGKPILVLTVGEEFIGAYTVLVLYSLALVIAKFSTPLQPAMLAMGKPHHTFWIHLISTASYFPLLYFFLLVIGLPGAGIAYIGYYLLWSLAMLIQIRKNVYLPITSTTTNAN